MISMGPYPLRPAELLAGSAPGRSGEELLQRLSRREREVFCLLTYRYTDQEIADTLCISYRTVTTHVANILNKLGVNSRREAAALLCPRDDR
jgi:DNA-binding CsgD family transcriptional regulator